MDPEQGGHVYVVFHLDLAPNYLPALVFINQGGHLPHPILFISCRCSLASRIIGEGIAELRVACNDHTESMMQNLYVTYTLKRRNP